MKFFSVALVEVACSTRLGGLTSLILFAVVVVAIGVFIRKMG